ncbi:hypothetical protein ABZ401_22275 [Streptomyces sp. NPDC005892]|uniref:hypothetical protein n=1 Tax=Streptomyces sp. NPDC005892 TaxID=3155593 RepID=UPI0033C89DE0
MNGVDPVRWISDHRDGIIRWIVVVCVALLLFLLVRHFAMKLGGWKTAGRRVAREIALTGAAFASPARAWLRYRRVLRTLVRRLRSPDSWHDAERALAAARLAAAPAVPYAVLVDDGAVTVLLAGRGVPRAPEPWVEEADENHPVRWTALRSDLPAVVPEAGLNRPVVVAIGAEDGSAGRCAFLDLATGPPTLALDGDERARAALLPTLAAQVGRRLPAGQTVVAEGVLRGFPGEPVREAYRRARDIPPRLGTPPFLAARELPDPLPPEMAGPPEAVPALRVLVLGSGRGYVRRLHADRYGQLSLPGTPLLLLAHALPRAVSRTLKRIPPVHPPAPSADGVRPLFEEEDEAVAAVLTESDPDEGVPTAAPAAREKRRAVPKTGGASAGSTPVPADVPLPPSLPESRPTLRPAPQPGTQAAAGPAAHLSPGTPTGPGPEPAHPPVPAPEPAPAPELAPGGSRRPTEPGADGPEPPVIWAGSDPDPGGWSGLVGGPGGPDGPHGPAESPGPGGRARNGPGGEPGDEPDPDAGVPAAPPPRHR